MKNATEVTTNTRDNDLNLVLVVHNLSTRFLTMVFCFFLVSYTILETFRFEDEDDYEYET